MTYWPWNLPIAETTRMLRFVPCSDITIFELAKIVASKSHDQEFELSREEVLSGIPDGCGRHFSLIEMTYERRGSKRKLIHSGPVYVMGLAMHRTYDWPKIKPNEFLRW